MARSRSLYRTCDFPMRDQRYQQQQRTREACKADVRALRVPSGIHNNLIHQLL